MPLRVANPLTDCDQVYAYCPQAASGYLPLEPDLLGTPRTTRLGRAGVGGGWASFMGRGLSSSRLAGGPSIWLWGQCESVIVEPAMERGESLLLGLAGLVVDSFVADGAVESSGSVDALIGVNCRGFGRSPGRRVGRDGQTREAPGNTRRGRRQPAATGDHNLGVTTRSSPGGGPAVLVRAGSSSGADMRTSLETALPQAATPPETQPCPRPRSSRDPASGPGRLANQPVSLPRRPPPGRPGGADRHSPSRICRRQVAVWDALATQSVYCGWREEDSHHAFPVVRGHLRALRRALDAPEPCLDSQVPHARDSADWPSSRGGVPWVPQRHGTAVSG